MEDFPRIIIINWKWYMEGRNPTIVFPQILDVDGSGIDKDGGSVDKVVYCSYNSKEESEFTKEIQKITDGSGEETKILVFTHNDPSFFKNIPENDGENKFRTNKNFHIPVSAICDIKSKNRVLRFHEFYGGKEKIYDKSLGLLPKNLEFETHSLNLMNSNGKIKKENFDYVWKSYW